MEQVHEQYVRITEQERPNHTRLWSIQWPGKNDFYLRVIILVFFFVKFSEDIVHSGGML